MDKHYKIREIFQRQKRLNTDRFLILEIILTCLLICLVVHTGYLIFTKLNPYGLNSDVSNEIAYRKYTWVHKTLFPTDFIVGHELLNNRPILLWWVFYAVTNNFLLSYQLEVFLTIILQMAAFWFLFSKLKLKYCVRLAVLCMYLCVWKVGSNFNMHAFHSIYSVFVMAVLVTLALRICFLERSMKKEPKKNFLTVAFLFGISAVLGFTSIRLAMSLYTPIVIMNGMRFFLDYINGREITPVFKKIIILDILCLLVNVGAYGMIMNFYSDAFTPIMINIRDISTWLNWDVLSSQLANVISTFGISGSGPITSLGGISFLLRGCFALFSSVAIVWLIQMKKEQSSNEYEATKEIIWYYISTTLVLFLLGVLSGDQIAGRYYWASALMIIVVCGVAMDYWLKQINTERGVVVCAMVTIGLIALFGVNVKQDSIAYSAEPPILVQVANYIKENGYQYVTGSYWNAGVIEGYTNGAVGYQHSAPDSGLTGELTEYSWVIDIKKYEQEQKGVPNILILTDNEETAFLANERSNYLLTNYGKKVQEIDIYNLYAFTENPFTLQKKVSTDLAAGLPTVEVRKKTDVLSNIGFHFISAMLNDAGELVTDGSAGSGFFGPYSQSVAGTYDITLHYIVDSYTEHDSGVFDVALDQEQLVGIPFTADETSVTLKNVVIEKDHLFEVRMFASEGMVVRVQSIDYERIE